MSSQQQFAIEKTMEVSKYMKALFKDWLHSKNGKVEMPDHWSLAFIQECHYMVHVLVNAAKNPGNSFESSILRRYQLPVPNSSHILVGSGLRRGTAEERSSVYRTARPCRKCVDGAVSTSEKEYPGIQALHCLG